MKLDHQIKKLIIQIYLVWILDKDDLLSIHQQLKQKLNEPTSSKYDKSELEKGLEAIDKKIENRYKNEAA